MDHYDMLYYSLIGLLEDQAAEPGVPNLFAPGSLCDKAYQRLVEARNRISAKLGQEDDPDLCQILSEMDTIQRTLCRGIMALRGL